MHKRIVNSHSSQSWCTHTPWVRHPCIVKSVSTVSKAPTPEEVTSPTLNHVYNQRTILLLDVFLISTLHHILLEFTDSLTDRYTYFTMFKSTLLSVALLLSSPHICNTYLVTLGTGEGCDLRYGGPDNTENYCYQQSGRFIQVDGCHVTTWSEDNCQGVSNLRPNTNVCMRVDFTSFSVTC